MRPSAFARETVVAFALLVVGCGGDDGSANGGGADASDSAVDPSGDSSVTRDSASPADGHVPGDTNGVDVPTLPPLDGGDAGPTSKGGTITFANIGAPGYWGRRVLAGAGDPRCDVESKAIDLGAAGGTDYCCRQKHTVTADTLTPFDSPMTLILRGPMHIAQLAVYQPTSTDAWARTSYFDARTPTAMTDLHFTGPGGTHAFTGDIGDSCSWYAMRAEAFPCGPSSDPYCPASGPDVDFQGWAGSKLLVFRATMVAGAPTSYGKSCGSGAPVDAPWIGFSASELMRDGWGKYFPCHCYDNTDGTVGAGCGEINVFETVPESEGAAYGNRTIMSTGLRSYQVGSFGGNVCGFGSCKPDMFAPEVDLVDACTKAAATAGVTLTYGAKNGPCPVWHRPSGERILFAFLDVSSRTIKVGMVHPGAAPAALVSLPGSLDGATIATLRGLQLPK